MSSFMFGNFDWFALHARPSSVGIWMHNRFRTLVVFRRSELKWTQGQRQSPNGW